ncbi:HEAT repeat domain-containing protein [Bremerella sp.]|uniref:HEAT repeat domain-containing protein n=1 Tax=Bremerella sp. TaxID=2795602 RepID=UPI0039187F28
MFLPFLVLILVGCMARADESDQELRKRWYLEPGGELQKDVWYPEHYFKVPDDLTDDEVRQMVGRLFVEDDNNHNFARLKLLGERAMPMLVEGLHHPRIASLRFKEERPIGGDSPLDRIISLIEPFGPAEAVAPLVSLAEHQDPYFRAEAAKGLASIGTAPCVTPLEVLLFDSDLNTRASASLGIRRILKEKRATEEFKQGIYPALQKDLAADKTDWMTARMMVEIDRERTLPIILASEMLSVNNPDIGDLLDVLNQKSVVLPLENLLPLIKAIQKRGPVNEYPSAYGEALKLYARNPDDKTEEVVRAALNSEDALVKYAALDSLVILAGMSAPIEYSRGLLKTQKLEKLTKPQQYCYCVDRYLFDLADGGHRFYFASTWGGRKQDLD